MSRAAVISLATVGALALGACSTSASTPSSPAPASSRTISRPPPTSTPKATAASQAPAGNACDDPAGDGGPGDISNVSLSKVGNNLRVVWTVKSWPKADQAGFYVNVSSADGSAAGQLGVKFLDGRRIGYFAFNSGTAKNVNLPGEPVVTATSVTATFPMAELSPYGTQFEWQAVTTGSGQDVDFCPDKGNDSLNPNQLRFTG